MKIADNLLAQKLRTGDTIGLIAPAGPVKNHDHFANGVRLLQDLGFLVKFLHAQPGNHEYLAADDKTRAKEFFDIWRDPEVKAIMAIRGGYGSLRLLASIDYSLIKKHPKIFIGFSDLSALHAAINQQTGLITFHGPVVTNLARLDDYSIKSFVSSLTSALSPPIKPPRLEILKAGNAIGKLSGGNLTTLTHLIATPFEQEWPGNILFLEDVCEAPYRIDRLLTHLKLAGKLDALSGVLLGSFEECGNEETIWKRTLELFEDFEIPIWANFPSGHGITNVTLPFGCQATMDSNTGTLSFLEQSLID